MAQLGESIDVDNIVPERGDFEPLPAGPYMVQVIDSDVIETKAGTGLILKLTMEVMDGPHANRKVWANLNFKNPNATAQRIAQEHIKQICDAVGHTGQLTDSEVLHYKPMRAQLTIRKSDEYGDQNEVKRYSALNGNAPPAGKPAPSGNGQSGGGQAQQSKPSGGSSGRPWGNRAA
ncbi:DUF669 domain-containing protein [Methylorubrum extorquens]|uniref:DUF669 domain-containing protein n=1 Tax=Methylorubrum extorquens TaxID=408 RepID=UPI001EE53ACC|nr:DUF669 domain-containing protein [Methylorubrum extorquens]MCG5247960.1 DUF669 domain-containing protein [Methylorubrum extorquens]